MTRFSESSVYLLSIFLLIKQVVMARIVNSARILKNKLLWCQAPHLLQFLFSISLLTFILFPCCGSRGGSSRL